MIRHDAINSWDRSGLHSRVKLAGSYPESTSSCMLDDVSVIQCLTLNIYTTVFLRADNDAIGVIGDASFSLARQQQRRWLLGKCWRLSSTMIDLSFYANQHLYDWVISIKIRCYSLMLITKHVSFLYEPGSIQELFMKHSEYWRPDALAPGHQWPQCCGHWCPGAKASGHPYSLCLINSFKLFMV